MLNAPTPKPEDLPSTARLIWSFIVAGVGAAFIAVAIYLPAEHGRDPTGVGKILGLKEMGEIKQQLKYEAAAEALSQGKEHSGEVNDTIGLSGAMAQGQAAWQDTLTFTLAPGEFTEIKATMEKGATLFYAWSSKGGRINFDLHAHTDDENVSYQKGRGQSEGAGSFETPFAGDHGWFWRNRDDEAVTITLQLSGEYSAVIKDD
ncbi:MAG: transmembrane anchor protein [Litoreibacter sp.]|nr:transmembrane anchor protein [Litoreibacter sp.]MCY4336546.1 transmembrane anchor protein [Litoreibacter sp.]